MEMKASKSSSRQNAINNLKELVEKAKKLRMGKFKDNRNLTESSSSSLKMIRIILRSISTIK